MLAGGVRTSAPDQGRRGRLLVIDGRRKMSVLVRYHKTDLELEADYETFADANAFVVHDDNTLEIRRDGEVIGFVHPERWDSVCTTEDADQPV